MGFPCDCISVLGSGQIIKDLHAEELKAFDSLHLLPAKGDRYMDPRPSLPEVNMQLLGLCYIESNIIVLTPVNQIIDLTPAH